MSRIVLHIGVPKTASSYIQSWLRLNQRQLSEHGVWVPTKPIYAHRLAVEHLSGPPWDSRPDVLEIRKTSLEEARHEFAEAAGANPPSVTIISSEYFYYADPSGLTAAMRHQFRADIDVIVFVRSQCGLALSGYNQDVKRLGKTATRPAPRYHKLFDWHRLLNNWAEHFGTDRIKAISFDLSAQRGTILSDFIVAAAPSLAAPLAEGVFIDGTVQNESLPADLLEFKRLANMAGATDIHDYRWLEELLHSGYVGPRFGVDLEEAEAWDALYRESNELVAREYFGGASVADIFPTNSQQGIDLEGKLPIETVVKLLAFIARRNEQKYKRLDQRLRALQADIVNRRTKKPEAKK